MYSRRGPDAMEAGAPQRLQKRGELVSGETGVAEDLAHEARADGFTGVHRDYRRTAVGMLKKVMASFDADDVKSGLAQGSHDVGAGRSRSSGHAAIVIR